MKSVSDKDVLHDRTLAEVFGFKKAGIRKLRALVETKGTGPTMMQKRLQRRRASKSELKALRGTDGTGATFGQ